MTSSKSPVKGDQRLGRGVARQSRAATPAMIQQKCLFDSYIVNDADVENLSPDTNEYKQIIRVRESPARGV